MQCYACGQTLEPKTQLSALSRLTALDQAAKSQDQQASKGASLAAETPSVSPDGVGGVVDITV